MLARGVHMKSKLINSMGMDERMNEGRREDKEGGRNRRKEADPT